MTAERLRALVVVSVAWLVTWMLLVTGAVWFGWTGVLEWVRVLIPLLIALPGAGFAYAFPMRLQHMRSVGEIRTELHAFLSSAVEEQFRGDRNVATAARYEATALSLSNRLESKGLHGDMPIALRVIATVASHIVYSSIVDPCEKDDAWRASTSVEWNRVLESLRGALMLVPTLPST